MFRRVEDKKVRLYERIIEEINRLLNAGELLPGDYLPPERELAETLGVSRVPVREALKTLEFMGVLKNTTKGAQVVDAGPLTSSGLQLIVGGRDAFEDLIEVRELIEVKVTELACERRTDEDLEALDQCINDMEQEVKLGGISVQSSLNFHRRLTKSARNSVLLRIMELLEGLLLEVREKSLSVPGRPAQSHEEHRRIVAAIRARDAKAACLEMAHHLAVMRENYAKYSAALGS